jgi:hypothetical protein
MNLRGEFHEILSKKLGFHSENVHPGTPFQREFDTDPAHLAHLLGCIPRGKEAIKTNLSKYPKTAPKPLKPHVLTKVQSEAVEFFAVNGQRLSPAFRLAELKKSFRILAKKLHPDVNPLGGEAFQKLYSAYEELLSMPLK